MADPASSASLMNNYGEKAWSDDSVTEIHHHRQPKSKARRIWSAVMSARSILDTILLLVILVLLLDKGKQAATPKPEESTTMPVVQCIPAPAPVEASAPAETKPEEPKKPEFQLGGDITGFGPKVSQQIRSFVPDHAFFPENATDFFSAETRMKWLSIVPRGLGYVQIKNTTGYDNLPHPLESYPKSTFTTSVTHQLHCLHGIAEWMATVQANMTYMMPADGDVWHMAHCIEYLRHSIMCCGDMAIEGQQTTFPDGIDGSDGWDAKHVCKDYDQVVEHLVKNAANNDTWI